MKRILFLVLFFSESSFCNSWLASGGFGLTFSPTLALLNPQMEYSFKPKIFVGPLMQLGIGDALLFTGTGTIRYQVGNHPQFKPCFEGGLGIALAGAGFVSKLGVHLMVGMGFDYQLESDLAVGTIIRANIAPPIKTLFISWPLLVARFLI